MPLFRRLYDLERRWRAHYNVVPVDDETWRRARIYNAWFDHAILRTFWTNEAEVAPGVLRSNHPTKRRLKRLKAAGLRSVLSLRASPGAAHSATERLWCEELGLTLRTVAMTDKAAPTPASLLALIETFREIERPFLIHCKAGADRAGLASAIYLMVFEGRPVAEARKMLSVRFLHLRSSRAGVLGAVLDAYEADGAGAAMPFEAWVATRYDPAAVAAAFAAGRGGKG
ncbi:tyrosine-protein phosphatase [Roseibacterium sp. SDUM158016]|uniref:phosphatase domain-containing protein n=1 Tax=Roseicyclus sediminis TaxID=2980997 RepID=UPI0021D0BE56|nr:tyrosine-protein phosphatase [Roseibacterium sp. SDUM158016]MCU4653672.1 tyrosine-protein phosphatase [Roseibacterium sp. SDUM158016]